MADILLLYNLISFARIGLLCAACIWP